MSWSVEFLEARRRLIDSDDYQRQRSLGHELSDGSIDTPLGSDVPSGVRFQCRFCGSVIRFGNSNWIGRAGCVASQRNFRWPRG